MSENKRIANTRLREGERIDELQRNGYVIIQDPKRFCFGMDAVLLSGFAHVKAGERVLDLGTGTGIIPILLEAKTDGSHFTGLEIQPESADMARRSVGLNHLESKIEIVTGDVKGASARPPALAQQVHSRMLRHYDKSALYDRKSWAAECTGCENDCQA